MENYFATEIPIGTYNGKTPTQPFKSFKHDDFIVHGPEGYQRIVIRAKSEAKLQELVIKLTN